MTTIDLGELSTSEAAELHTAAVEEQATQLGLRMPRLSMAGPLTTLATIARRRAQSDAPE